MIKPDGLSKAAIEKLIPHSRGMCLLEKVVSYSSEEIICQTQTHLAENNPLKEEGLLSKMHLIEYGAQAIAIHGGLMEAERSTLKHPKMGYIAMVKSVKWNDFNPLTALLEIKAHSIVTDEAAKLYEFFIMDAEQDQICTGKVMIMHPTEQN